MDASLGPNGGGSTNTVYVIDFPFIPGSGNGGIGPVIDPNGPGGTYLNNPVYITPVSTLSGVFQDFYYELDNNDQQLELLSNPDLRNGIINLVNVLGPYQAEAFALAEKIIDLSRAGFEEEALQILEYLNDGGENEIAEDMMESVLDGTAISLKPFFKFPPGNNYATLYPDFTYMVKNEIPTLYNMPNLVSTISTLTGLSANEVIQNLKWGSGPEINIVQLGLDPNGFEYNGKFNPSTPDKIYIDIDLIEHLEEYVAQHGETSQTGFIRQMIMFSVCLHELVHYGDYDFDGLMQDNAQLELGELFEELFMGGSFDFDENHRVIFVKYN